jgi:hypothetical protein
MAALRPDQPKTAAASAIIGTPGTQVTPRPGRYEIDTSCSAVTSTRIDRTEFGVTAYRGVAGRYLDMTVEVRCVRT